VSAPIYVVVGGDERTWKRDAVSAVVDRLVTSLDQLEKSTLESVGENEWWEAEPAWRKVWAQQFAALKERIAEARSRLEELAAQARVN
jgi:vancomycin resistance protein YoaR